MSELQPNHFAAQARNTHPNALVVLIHGGAVSGRMYKDVIPLLTSKGYDVFAPDLPGHGASVSLAPFTIDGSSELLLAMLSKIKQQYQSKVILTGVSLGGQVVLNTLRRDSHNLVDAAIVSGVSIHPPDEVAQWEMPHMPTDDEWLKVIMEDVSKIEASKLPAIQEESLGFTFAPPKSGPPTLVVLGENDIAMARRDFSDLTKLLQGMNEKSESMLLKDAWHNHPIDVPDKFAELIKKWAQTTI